jgi:undecaprenyl-phosphate 4-deoxy-4-formamido-L-arabinose transferase
VHPLVAGLEEVLSKSGRTYEIVLVNDGSPDATWERIAEAVRRWPSVVGVNLRRNFGQHNAILAGLHHARGRVVVTMDDDLQHDPRDIEALVAAVERGWDVCYARFRDKKRRWWKGLGSAFHDRMAEIVIAKPRDVYLSPFRALSRGVVDELVSYPGAFPYLDGLIFRTTQRITQVEAEHHDRYAGASNYGLFNSLGLWIRLMTGHSVMPLRFAAYAGFASAALGLLMAAFHVIVKLLGSPQPVGWASMMVTILVLGGVQLACLGMIGEYLGRLYMNVNLKPQFVVREVLGGPHGAERDPDS